MSFFKKIFSSEKKETLDKGLEKSKTSFFDKLSKAVAGKSKVDDDVLDNLEEILVTSDVGVNTTLKVIERIEERVAKDKYLGTSELNKILREEIAGLLSETNVGEASEFTVPTNKKPYVMMVVGVNGVGKTTTIGKLAYQFKKQGLKVVLGAADTFRAAAIDQLQVWADRVDVPIVKQSMGSDPASVAFDTLQSAVSMDADVVIIDTAGLRESRDSVERIGIERAWQEIEQADRILLVYDASEYPKGDPDLRAIWPEFFDRLQRSDHISIIRNKIDLLKEASVVQSDTAVPHLGISARAHEGIDALREHLKECVGYDASSEGTYTARRRHLLALESALAAVIRGKEVLVTHNAGELLAEELRIAQEALNEITGRFSADDLLGEIFSSFCIGK